MEMLDVMVTTFGKLTLAGLSKPLSHPAATQCILLFYFLLNATTEAQPASLMCSDLASDRSVLEPAGTMWGAVPGLFSQKPPLQSCHSQKLAV